MPELFPLRREGAGLPPILFGACRRRASGSRLSRRRPPGAWLPQEGSWILVRGFRVLPGRGPGPEAWSSIAASRFPTSSH